LIDILTCPFYDIFEYLIALMAFQTFWYSTKLPQEIIDIIIKDLKKNKTEELFEESSLIGGQIDHKKRKSKNTWIPTSHWLGGFLWFYVDKMNQENFRYDISGIDGDSIQYTQYEVGEFYKWHVDTGFDVLYEADSTRNSAVDETTRKSYFADFLKLNNEFVRKLSFTVQLSDPDSYEGGEVQLMDDNDGMYTLPKEQGTIVVFDSRARHRVRKVTKGTRRSLVGWCIGPRWK